jgi:triosephosphate isomerase
MSKKLIVGNWKMNPQTIKEGQNILKAISRIISEFKNADVVVCPPFPYLATFIKDTKTKKIRFGAQNVSGEVSGAYTGEVGASMLSSIKVSHVIIGHSERRALGETNESVNQKIKRSFQAKLTVILCVGESVRDAHGEYLGFVKQQLHECLEGVSKAQLKNIVIAYEPVWAIGKDATREATADEFTEMRIFIRRTIADMFDTKSAQELQVLYGGSAHPENAPLFIDALADGFLVGRDSLIPRKFEGILKATNKK